MALVASMDRISRRLCATALFNAGRASGTNPLVTSSLAETHESTRCTPLQFTSWSAGQTGRRRFAGCCVPWSKKNPALARWGKPVQPLRKIQSPPAGDSTSVAALVAWERCPKANKMPLTATQLAAIPNAMAARTVKNKVAKLKNKLKVRPTCFLAAP